MIGPAVPVAAASPVADVVIAQVQTGASESASQEYVALYNNASQDIDVTGWCLLYNTSTTKPGCIEPSSPDMTVWLRVHSYTTFASSQFVAAHDGFVPQARASFSGGLADGGGTLTLLDSGGAVHDQFSWSSKADPDMIYQRVTSDSVTFQNTGNNATDFVQAALVIPTNLGLYEQPQLRDMCPNLPDIQTVIPEGFLPDTAGDCQPDMCPNIAGLQVTTPVGYQLTTGGACEQIPLENAPLSITELLPNPTSYDTGNEFVELYNSLDRPVQLVGYTLQLGPAFTKSHTFTAGTIESQQYSSFSDTELGITLPNTTASLRLIAPDGTIVSETEAYHDSADNMAWAFIDRSWQYTNVPTPGAANQETDDQVASVATGTAATVKPCPAGKYRNPETNRCRTIQVATGLTPCGPNQYRNPATNRCRNLAVLAGSTLTPCGPDQERNPTTNRCRKIAAATNTLQPCGEGKERNPETNRCRTVLSASSSNTKANDSTANNSRAVNLVIVAGVVTSLLGYAIYEYRYDLQNIYLKIRHK